ncbi:hypothetical protein QBC33DRAFT_523786 [Phialemonium atrogriseum]|uniref:Uncharacterized protein n=1 Tax=Phialemonium atrogriseum TaxID=1093897 RepID=A0AAJ0C7A5_9PEZI|nr:uncharacterized protein QBC33DRAFT_523786 [Phialemonium atrogriseum]KAK1771459.1 hypothetical protein QBC33DRAFT_523786 [Phialemonium atrogriseum]
MLFAFAALFSFSPLPGATLGLVSKLAGSFAWIMTCVLRIPVTWSGNCRITARCRTRYDGPASCPLTLTGRRRRLALSTWEEGVGGRRDQGPGTGVSIGHVCGWIDLTEAITADETSDGCLVVSAKNRRRRSFRRSLPSLELGHAARYWINSVPPRRRYRCAVCMTDAISANCSVRVFLVSLAHHPGFSLHLIVKLIVGTGVRLNWCVEPLDLYLCTK